MPAATGNETTTWLASFISELEAEGVKLNVIVLLTSEPATFEQAVRYRKALPPAVSFIYVANEMRGELALIKDGWTEAAAGGKTIRFPALRRDLSAELQVRGLTPQAAIDAPDDRKGAILAAASGRIPLRAWLREVFAELDKVAGELF